MSQSSPQPDSSQRLLAICGITGPILYAIVVIILGFLEPGYSHAAQSMSELGAVGARYATIMNTAGFPLLGLLIIVFALGLDRGIRDGKGAKIGPALVAVSGAALVMTGIFRCDPGCVDVTMVGTTHSVFAVIAAFAMLLAPLAISPRLKRDERWKSYLAYSVATAVIALLVTAVYGFNVFESWEGALQRISMGIPLIWVEVMALKLLRLP